MRENFCGKSEREISARSRLQIPQNSSTRNSQLQLLFMIEIRDVAANASQIFKSAICLFRIRYVSLRAFR